MCTGVGEWVAQVGVVIGVFKPLPPTNALGVSHYMTPKLDASVSVPFGSVLGPLAPIDATASNAAAQDDAFVPRSLVAPVTSAPPASRSTSQKRILMYGASRRIATRNGA